MSGRVCANPLSNSLNSLPDSPDNHTNRFYFSISLHAATADANSTSENGDQTQTKGECLAATAQRSQSSPSSLIEDSGTESGEDLRLLNPELLAEVRGALTKLESALPNLDTARRASIIPLVTKLQSCLKVSENPQQSGTMPASSHTTYASNKRFASKQRKTRHTVGVSKEELADARKWLAENFLDDAPKPAPMPTSTASIPLKYETKVYKPVKFTPIPPRENRDKNNNAREYPLVYAYLEKPTTQKPLVKDTPKPSFAFRSYVDPGLNPYGHYPEDQFLKDNYSSGEGDVSSTEEETIRMETDSTNQNRYMYGQSDASRKVPTRFHQKNNKKMRMKRANTIDIPKLLSCGNVTSSGDESAYKSADELRKRAGRLDLSGKKVQPPPLEVRTEKDKKFAEFLRQTMQDEQATRTIAYNPSAAGGAQWSNRFSHIKTAFEGGNNAGKSSSSPEDMSKLFKPIRKVATFPKESQSEEKTFSHAHSSPFKPVTRAGSFYNSQKPASRDSGYDSRCNSIYHSDQNIPKQFFSSLERKTVQLSAQATPKTYYPPSVQDSAPAPRKVQSGYNNSYNGYVQDHKPTLYFINAPQDNFALKAYNPVKQTPNYPYYATPPKTEYFLNEPSAYLHVPEYPSSNLITSQPVSPTMATTCSSSPTYPDNYEPYLSLPTSPINNRVQPVTGYWKPVEYSEEQPAVSKIMGKPQQAVVTNSKTSYRNQPAQPLSDQSRAAFQKSSPARPQGQQTPRVAPKETPKPKPTQPSSAIKAPDGSIPSFVKKQVKIVALNDSEENLPEQFFVQNQRNKFESLSAQSGNSAPQPLPPQINEKAFFKPVGPASAAKRRDTPPMIVEQSRSPPQSPVIMPSVLQKSESWHQMIMERMKQAKPPSPIKPKIPRARSTHNLACVPKQYEATLSPESIGIKQQTVEQFLRKDRERQRSKSPGRTTKELTKRETAGAVTVTKLDEDFKHVDEAFEVLFNEASGRGTRAH